MNAPSASLWDLTNFIDELLDIKNVADWPNALNGLQLENAGSVRKIGAAVDAGEATLRMAIEAGVDFLLVHHGLFWSGLQPVTGPAYSKLAAAVRAGLAIYSAHLPLDLHAEIGNNALLARTLGLENTAPFFFEKGRFLGVQAQVAIPLPALIQRLENAVNGPVKLCPGGRDTVARVGIVTGGAGGEINRAAAEGVDTFITGEAPHWAAVAAEELGVNLLLAGHYATETFGVKALAARLSERFGLPWVFLDHPTGL